MDPTLDHNAARGFEFFVFDREEIQRLTPFPVEASTFQIWQGRPPGLGMA